MDLRASTRIPFDRETVFRTLRDRLVQLAPYMPNVRQIEEKERHEESPRTRFVNIWTAKTEIPTLAKAYLKADEIKWTDRALWDETTWICDWAIEPHVLPGVVQCGGRNTYTTIGSETQLEIVGTLTLNLDKLAIPRLLASTVKPVVEKIVITALKPNLLSIGEGVTSYLRASKPA